MMDLDLEVEETFTQQKEDLFVELRNLVITILPIKREKDFWIGKEDESHAILSF